MTPELDQAALNTPTNSAATWRRPKLGFLGVGWIGRHRLEAIAMDGMSDIIAVVDHEASLCEAACALAPGAKSLPSFDNLLALPLDGLVIATPSALHAQQAEAALERGMAVFCQKPLGRTAAETLRVIEVAQRSDCLLGVDLSYRHTQAMQCVRETIASGAVGQVYAVDLVFHNAYGPDKDWFRNPALAGGGCVIDLGIHMVDLALWVLDFPRVEDVTSRLHAQGRRLALPPPVVEDHAFAQIDLAGGCVIRLACSWNLPAGRDAVIEARFHGTSGGAAMRNVEGSFYDFAAERYDRTYTFPLSKPPDPWGGRGAVRWARALGAGARFDPEVERLIQVASVLDAIYGR